MRNSYEIRGDVTVIFLKRRDGKILETLIDTDDFEKVNALPVKWFSHLDKGTKSFYVRANIKIGNTHKTILMHRYIMDANDMSLIDHINRNSLDNRRNNLRTVNHIENGQNKSIVSKTNSSGVRGVFWNKQTRSWKVMLKVNKKQIFLGYFKEKEKAITAVRRARARLMPYSQEALGRRMAQ